MLELLGCDAEVNDATDAHIADVLECHDVRDRWELMYGLTGIGVMPSIVFAVYACVG